MHSPPHPSAPEFRPPCDREDLRPRRQLLAGVLAVTANASGVNVLVALCLALALWPKADSGALLVWLALMLAVQGGRVAAAQVLRARTWLQRDDTLVFQVLLGGAALSGLTWGVTLPFVGPYLSTEWRLLVLTVIAGMGAGAVSTLGNSLALVVAFVQCATLPAAAWMYLRGGELGPVAAVLAVVFAVNLSLIGRKAAQRASRLAELACANADLARDLLQEKTRVDRANRDLRRALEKQAEVEHELRRHRDRLEDLVAEQTADLRRAKDRAETANQAKSDFLANISHELRTPMHAILSFADLGERKGETKSARYFRRIRSSGERLLLLLNDLLDLSKLESDRAAPQREQLDLAELFAVSRAEVAGLLASKTLSLELHCEVGTPPCDGERGALLQALSNLLGNAIKFSPPGARIEVGLRRLVRHGIAGVGVAIRDYGVGIPPSELESVFDKFVQSSRTKTGAGGTGLGLAICREIIEQHGGHIWAEPSERGALFRFWLPPGHGVPDGTPVGDASVTVP